MRPLLFLVWLTPVLFAAREGLAQDSLSNRDAIEIRYKAESIIKKELNELFNSISSTAFESQEIAESIHSSYSTSRNQIFRDSLVQVEDDISPASKTSTEAAEEIVDKYLKDLDLLYSKTDSASIGFTNIRSSNVKKKDNIYIKVYFNSLFSGKHSGIDSPYILTNRLAEIKAEKDKNQWHVYIVRLGFFNPADTVGDVLNDMPVKHEMMKLNLAAGATAQDSAVAIQKQMSFDEEEQQRTTRIMMEKDREDELRLKKLISLGDAAFNKQDFITALKNYNQAQELDQNSREVRVKIKKTNEEIALAAQNANQLFKKLTEKAALEAKNRQYKEAIEDYNNAIKTKPEESANYDAQIRDLTKKYRILTELQEKYNNGLYKEAVKEYNAAIEKDKTNSDFYLERGRCYEQMTESSKNIGRALDDYSRAIDLDNSNLAAIRCRAELLTHTGEYYKALTDYKVYLTIDDEDMSIYERKSELHVLLNRPKDAIADLDEALVVNPKAAHIYIGKGLLQYNQSQPDSAIGNFTTSIRIDSTNPVAWYNRGRCEMQTNKVPAASADFGTARSKGLDSNSCRIVNGYAEQLYGRADARYGSNVTDSAIILIDYAISIDTSSSLYPFRRGEYCYSLAKFNEAITSYDRAILLNKAYQQAWYRRGLAQYRIAQYHESIESFQHAIQLNPQDVMAGKGEGDADLALHDYANASVAYENALKIALNSKNSFSPEILADIYNALSKAYYQQGDDEKAVANARNAIRANKNFAEAYYNRGVAYYRQGQLSDAIDDLTKALRLEDNHYNWHYVLAKSYQDKKDLNNALPQYASAARLDTVGRVPDAIYKQGYCHYQMQNYPEALPFYTRSMALRLDTALPSFNLEMGTLYLHTGKYDSAYAFYQMAYLKDSTNGLASYGIASSVALQGKADESLTWFEKSFQTKTVNYSDFKKDKLLADLRNNKKFVDQLKKYARQ